MTLIERSSLEEQSPGAERGSAARRGQLQLSMVLRHGAAVDLQLRYELCGPEELPLLIAAGGISAGRHVFGSRDFPDRGWWEEQKASFRPDRYRILSFDWVGADGLIDAPIDPSDQADALVQLMDWLNLPVASGFIGASYGAMVGMHLASRHPARIGALLAISAAARSHPYASARRALQRQVLRLGEAAGRPLDGVALARAMAMLTYRTPEEFAERFTDHPRIEDGRLRVAAEAYLDAQGERHRHRMSATAYRRLSESIDLHAIEPVEIGVPITLVAVDRDSLVPADDVQALAGAVSDAHFHLIHSRFGHDAFLKEHRAVAEIIGRFLDSLEHAP